MSYVQKRPGCVVFGLLDESDARPMPHRQTTARADPPHSQLTLFLHA